MEKREWLRTEVIELISCYESFSCLWDIYSPDYRDRAQKAEALKCISEKFDTTNMEILRKIHNLRNQFNNELKRTQGRIKYTSKWPNFKSLLFLVGVTGLNKPPPQRYINVSRASHLQAGVGVEFLNVPADSADENSLHEVVPLVDIRRQENNLHDAVTSQQQSPTDNRRHEKRPHNWPEEDSNVSSRSKSSSKSDDEYDVFGAYVANELRSLDMDYLRKKLKRYIQRAILDVADEEADTQAVDPLQV